MLSGRRKALTCPSTATLLEEHLTVSARGVRVDKSNFTAVRGLRTEGLQSSALCRQKRTINKMTVASRHLHAHVGYPHGAAGADDVTSNNKRLVPGPEEVHSDNKWLVPRPWLSLYGQFISTKPRKEVCGLAEGPSQ